MFDLFFRKNPFKGQFTVFAGLDEALRFVSSFSFSASDIEYLRETVPSLSPEYLEYLGSLDGTGVEVMGMAEGSIVFPRMPLLRISGPLGVCQLMETTLLNIVNYASLMATNAARFVQAARKDSFLLEFGLRRAQGPDGAMSASRYSYLGGFHGTSNVAAGKAYGIPIKGTHAHSFVCSFISQDDIPSTSLVRADGSGEIDLAKEAGDALVELGFDPEMTNDGEMAAFLAYAIAFPSTFLALVDTYSTLESGVPNFMAVSLALVRAGYTPVGIRLDSGDLAALSRSARAMFLSAADALEEKGDQAGAAAFRNINIVASDGINETLLRELEAAEHEINTFGIGTNLVTCQAQPALGCVFKLVEIRSIPRIKLSQNIGKVTIPVAKQAYRLYNKDGVPLIDVLTLDSEDAPVPGVEFVCRDPLVEGARLRVIPSAVDQLLTLRYQGGVVDHNQDLKACLEESRTWCLKQQELFEAQVRCDDPVAYKVYLSPQLHAYFHDLWLKETPVPVLQ